MVVVGVCEVDGLVVVWVGVMEDAEVVVGVVVDLEVVDVMWMVCLVVVVSCWYIGLCSTFVVVVGLVVVVVVVYWVLLMCRRVV